MITNPKALTSLIISATLIAGCGSAQDSELKKEVDEIPPIIEKVSPDSITRKGEIGIDEKAIILKISESINQNDVDLLNAQEIRSTNNTLLEGIWDFNTQTNELTFTITTSPIPPNESFAINISGKLTDKAGNALLQDKSISFSTAKLFGINITASGLSGDDSVTVTQKFLSGSQTTNNLTLSTATPTGLINGNLASNEEFLLSVSEQPADKFCSLSTAYGKISLKNAEVTLNCQDVIPYYSSAQNWNDYVSVDANKLNIHGGESRALVITGLSSCENISASDKLDSFNWACEEVSTNDSTKIRVYSTGLKENKGLSNLINFDTAPSWKENSITVSNLSGTIRTTDSSVWWNNPVLKTPDVKTLATQGAIYAHIDKNGTTPDLKQDFQITKSNIALVINPNMELTTELNGISVTGSTNNTINYVWIEGKINAASSVHGIALQNAPYARLNKVIIKNSEQEGISLLKSYWTKLTNVTVTNSTVSGLVINDSEYLGFGVEIINSTFSFNGESGILANSSKTRLLKVNASSNGQSGLIITTPYNIVSNTNLSNNIENGLIIRGTQNNLLSGLTVANNHGNGILLEKDSSGNYNPRTNLISSSTIANNKLSAIQFNSIEQSIAESNMFVNIVDAYNLASNCTHCDNMTTATLADGLIDSIFATVSTDSNVPSYSPSAGLNSSEITTRTKLENIYRNWGAFAAPTETEGSGSCVTASHNCKIYDWSLSSSDTLILNTIGEPVGLKTFAFTSSTGKTISYLENSIEVNTDNIGNNNGFCEENETCILVTNNGSYQGHGTLSTYADTTNTWTDLGITMQKYNSNGY